MIDTKTPDQLKREIRYFAGVIQRTTSRDRIRRAHAAIAVRERQLTEALRVRMAPPPADRPSVEPRVGS